MFMCSDTHYIGEHYMTSFTIDWKHQIFKDSLPVDENENYDENCTFAKEFVQCLKQIFTILKEQQTIDNWICIKRVGHLAG